MVTPHALLFLSTLFFGLWTHIPLQAQDSHVRVVWSFEGEQDDDLFKVLPECFPLKRLTYTVDALFARHELIELLGCDDGSVVSREQLRNGLRLLGLLGRFQRVVLDGVHDPDGWVIHLHITSWWLLAKVRCKGALLGKERYRHCYQSGLGQRFDTIKHHDSLLAIEGLLHADGYLAPEVVDVVVYNDERKTVDVTLVLDPGPRYSVRAVEVIVLDAPDHRSVATKMRQVALHELYGQTYDVAMIERLLHQLEQVAAHEGFLQPSLTYEPVGNAAQASVTVVFKVALGERRQFSFFGNHFFSDHQLMDRLQLFGKSILLLPPSILADELVELYKSRGFWSVKITWEEESGKDVGRSLFCITEGPRVRIAAVSFDGVAHFSQEKAASFFADLLRAPFFDKQKKRSCRDQFLQAYVRAGFWDCAIIKEEWVKVSEGVHALRVVVREGEQRFIRSVTVPEFEQAVRDLPLAGPFPQGPVPFDMYCIQEQRNALVSYCQTHGYLSAHPRPLLKQGSGGIMDVVWEVGRPQQVCFGTTVVAGASRLGPELIRRELAYEEGEIWNQKKVERSVARLKALGVFESVSLRPIDLPGVSSQRNLVANCIDDDPFEVRVRAGMQCVGQYFRFHDIGARLGGAMIWKNPTNRADRLQVALDVSPYMRYGELEYVVPWLGEWPILTTTSLYSSRYDQPLVTCGRERLYRLAQDGCSVSFEYDTGSAKLGCVAGFESMKVSQISRHLARLIDFDPRLIDTRVPYLYVEPLVIWSWLDDAYNPMCGTSTMFTSKVMLPLRRVRDGFFKILVEQSMFVPLWRRAVCAVHLRAGHIFNADFSDIMPSERFYLGGAYSLRGYDTDTAPPVSCCANRLGSPCLLPIGGKSVISMMTEMRFPLYDALGGVIFTDCGVLVRRTIEEDSLVGATGCGVRYATPVGPVRFDIAWKWRRQQGEDHRFSWFLTFGQAF